MDDDDLDFSDPKILKDLFEIDENACLHLEFIEEDGKNICKICGMETYMITYDPEWRYYGESDSRASSDPSRCHRSKADMRDDSTYIKFNIQISDAIKNMAWKKYKKIMEYNAVHGQNSTNRGVNKDSILANCVLYSFRNAGCWKSSDEIRLLFHLKKKSMSVGKTRYLEVFPEDRVEDIKPADLIASTAIKIGGLHQDHIEKIQKFARFVDTKSYTLNSSKVGSVAAALIWLYLCIFPSLKNNLGLSKQKFSELVGYSEMTIKKLSIELARFQNRTITNL